MQIPTNAPVINPRFRLNPASVPQSPWVQGASFKRFRHLQLLESPSLSQNSRLVRTHGGVVGLDSVGKVATNFDEVLHGCVDAFVEFARAVVCFVRPLRVRVAASTEPPYEAGPAS